MAWARIASHTAVITSASARHVTTLGFFGRLYPRNLKHRVSKRNVHVFTISCKLFRYMCNGPGQDGVSWK